MLDDALVQDFTIPANMMTGVSILVMLDDALVQTTTIVEACKRLKSQSLLCWTML